MVQGFLQVVMGTKKFAEISQGSELIDPNELMDQVIAEVRLGHPEHIHHAVSILTLLKKSISKVRCCGAESVDSNCNIVMKMMENMSHES